MTTLTDLSPPSFDTGARRGFPAFHRDEAHSTPLNASPYVAALPEFVAHFSLQPSRRQLLEAWLTVLERSHAAGVDVAFALVGGSFLRTEHPEPRDLDCALFYRLSAAGPEHADAIADLQSRARIDGVDARYVPLDAQPLLAYKAIAFFAVLFARRKTSSGAPYGTVLVDCSGAALD